MARAAKKEEGWRCPRCGRRFLRRPGEHSCDVRALAAHLDRASDSVRDTFAALHDALSTIGPLNIVPVKTMILLRATANFGGVVVRRDALHVEFVLPRALSHQRIYRSERLGPDKHTHHIRLGSPSEVDGELVAWLQESYRLVEGGGSRRIGMSKGKSGRSGGARKSGGAPR